MRVERRRENSRDKTKPVVRAPRFSSQADKTRLDLVEMMVIGYSNGDGEVPVIFN